MHKWRKVASKFTSLAPPFNFHRGSLSTAERIMNCSLVLNEQGLSEGNQQQSKEGAGKHHKPFEPLAWVPLMPLWAKAHCHPDQRTRKFRAALPTDFPLRYQQMSENSLTLSTSIERTTARSKSITYSKKLQEIILAATTSLTRVMFGRSPL